jgi:hypothetical protein
VEEVFVVENPVGRLVVFPFAVELIVVLTEVVESETSLVVAASVVKGELCSDVVACGIDVDSSILGGLVFSVVVVSSVLEGCLLSVVAGSCVVEGSLGSVVEGSSDVVL